MGKMDVARVFDALLFRLWWFGDLVKKTSGCSDAVVVVVPWRRNRWVAFKTWVIDNDGGCRPELFGAIGKPDP
ncbi:hypothetical protein QVD17_19145 [Tagetes erecta]|uniref:Uncharacterized protein n=1 Tax=Tagetes erecta TaxID=13708 RepID=A0AAD8KMG6_TARER|nr:hypothetical protein QVD17_19145 [Tagetes erecta]